MDLLDWKAISTVVSNCIIVRDKCLKRSMFGFSFILKFKLTNTFNWSVISVFISSKWWMIEFNVSRWGNTMKTLWIKNICSYLSSCRFSWKNSFSKTLASKLAYILSRVVWSKWFLVERFEYRHSFEMMILKEITSWCTVVS